MHYEIHIDENGKTRNATYDINERNIHALANYMVLKYDIKENASVRFARMGFDSTTDSFRITEYKFTVKEGKAHNLVLVKQRRDHARESDRGNANFAREVSQSDGRNGESHKIKESGGSD